MEERRKRIRLFVGLVTLATTLAFSPTLWALIVNGEVPTPVREELQAPTPR